MTICQAPALGAVGRATAAGHGFHCSHPGRRCYELGPLTPETAFHLLSFGRSMLQYEQLYELKAVTS